MGVQKPRSQIALFRHFFLFFFSKSSFFKVFFLYSSQMKLHLIAFFGTLVIAMVSTFPIEKGSENYEVGRAKRAKSTETDTAEVPDVARAARAAGLVDDAEWNAAIDEDAKWNAAIDEDAGWNAGIDEDAEWNAEIDEDAGWNAEIDEPFETSTNDDLHYEPGFPQDEGFGVLEPFESIEPMIGGRGVGNIVPASVYEV